METVGEFTHRACQAVEADLRGKIELLEASLEASRRRRQTLIQALEWYAEPEHHAANCTVVMTQGQGLQHITRVGHDGGERARAALDQYGTEPGAE